MREKGHDIFFENYLSKETIVNCFSECGFDGATFELFIDDNADAEFAGLKNYISETFSDTTVDSYLNQDKYAVTSVNMVDIEGGPEGKTNSLHD